MTSEYVDDDDTTLFERYNIHRDRVKILQGQVDTFGPFYSPPHILLDLEATRKTSRALATELIRRGLLPQAGALPEEAPSPPPDFWHSSGAAEFIHRSNCNHLLYDGAILMEKYPNRRNDDWGWKETEFHIRHDEADGLVDTALPPDLMDLRQRHFATHPTWKDSVKYCVQQFAVDRGGADQVTVHTRPISFLTAYPVAHMLWEGRDTVQGQRLRTRYFQRLLQPDRPLQPGMLIAHVAVVTGDKQLVLMRRKETQGYFGGQWSASFEEHYNAEWRGYLASEDVYEESVDSSIGAGIRRGLQEEIYLTDGDVTETTIRILGFGFEYTNFNTSIYAVAELPRTLTYTRLKERLKASTEHSLIDACAINLPTLIPVLRSGTPPQALTEGNTQANESWIWHPTARMRIFLVLCRYFHEAEIHAALQEDRR